MTEHDDSFLDGCEIDMSDDVVEPDEQPLLILFAEALDPNTPKTVDEAKAEWETLFS
jgi:hypothetical protein